MLSEPECVGARAGDGQSASRHLLHWGAQQQCSDRNAFSRDIVKLFERECDIRRPCGIDLDKVRDRKEGERQGPALEESRWTSTVIVCSQYALSACGVAIPITPPHPVR